MFEMESNLMTISSFNESFAEISYLSDMFENLTKKAVVEILMLLGLRFKIVKEDDFTAIISDAEM